MRALFDVLPGPAVTSATRGPAGAGCAVTAVDGTTLDVPDTVSPLVSRQLESPFLGAGTAARS